MALSLLSMLSFCDGFGIGLVERATDPDDGFVALELVVFELVADLAAPEVDFDGVCATAIPADSSKALISSLIITC